MNKIPNTVAIIMDGNGRWAQQQGLPRTAGHKQGAETIRIVALEANRIGIKKLILYAFSTENWKRPEEEKNYLFKLPGIFFAKYIKELQENNIRVTYAGELERFPQATQTVINKAVAQTADNTGLELCLAINYGARRELILAMRRYAQDVQSGRRGNTIEEADVSNYLMVPEEIDLMIRTSGEFRISNFLLWQIAYAELIFTPVAWPAFDEQALHDCLDEYAHRDRRYGGLTK
ncbi:isoprenyl transferase [Catenisphaera adipataccumulans]|uniref:Isoprenyl transferase n=1 Tax=Catenisphaera adipataccumulans TaxID=700500 RepID=A0A7W8CZL1_9FIRM|nr:isoprenyl transferase [Catenisphaera adipataccumulans]MBB5183914.1 undecaprenyl diphosphate synthase [Catenisphaera adipataccumulans]